jgi:hypothetical protein
VNFLKPGKAVRTIFIEIYRFFSIFSVFGPSIEPEFWAEKPPCIEGLFSGMAPGTPKVAKMIKNDVFSIKYGFYDISPMD